MLISGYVTPPGVEANPPEEHGTADVTGDRYTDLVTTKPDGTMWLYSNNFNRDGGQPYTTCGRSVRLERVRPDRRGGCHR